jgi:hypothetical protein
MPRPEPVTRAVLPSRVKDIRDHLLTDAALQLYLAAPHH